MNYKNNIERSGYTDYSGIIQHRLAAYNLSGPHASDDDGYVIPLITHVALSHIVMDVRYLMSHSC